MLCPDLLVSEEIDSAYTSDAALYNPFLDSDQEFNDPDSEDGGDGQISDSEADRVRINYTEHFDGSIGQTADDICEELYENELENENSILPESQQDEGEIQELYSVALEEQMEVTLCFKCASQITFIFKIDTSLHRTNSSFV